MTTAPARDAHGATGLPLDRRSRQAILAGGVSRGLTLRLAPDAVRAIATSEYPLPARRPANSRLDTGKLQRTFGLVLPHWQAGLDHVLDQISKKS